MDFTERNIVAWRKYEKVRKGGRYNMFDPRARRATGLSKEEYLFVLANFSALKARAEATTIEQDSDREMFGDEPERFGLENIGNK